ncbi:MAG: hypothetical protein JWN98_697 [Abditibacteriota bacterium]|nr:hypothetical protein [Abditibacteriota bacterium]
MSSSTPIHVLIVRSDDNLVARAGLQSLLDSCDGIQVIGAVGNGEDALSIAEQTPPHIVLIDVDAGPQEIGFTIIEALIQSGCQGRMLALMSAGNSQKQHRAVACGAVGLVYREQSPEVLFKAIRCVAAGEVWIDRTTTANALIALQRERIAQENDPNLLRIATLSTRERELILLIGEGLKNKEIASRLFLSESTVRNHLSSIFEKLHVNDRLELVIFAYRYGLASLPV